MLRIYPGESFEFKQQHNVFKTWFFIIGLSLSLTGFSQESSVVTLSQCIDSVQKYSFRLQAETFNTEAALKNLDVSHTRTMPYLSGDVGIEGRSLNPYGFGQQWTLVHGDWSLGDFIRKTDQVARQEVVTSQLMQEQARLDGISRVTSLFMNVLQKEKERELLNERIGLLKTHRIVAASLWQAGVRTRLDILQTESELSVAKEEKVRVLVEIRNSIREITNLTGMTMLDTFQLETINTKDLIQQVNISDLDRQLITENPLYQVLLSKVQTRRLQTDLINAQKWPHVVAGGGYFVDGDPTADGNYWTIQAGIAFPIYQWGSINYQKEESEALGKSLNMELLDLNRELLIHLEKTMIRLEELNNMLELQETRLETLQEAQSLADINYKAGLITNLEYLVTQQRNTTTMITIEETRLEYILNLIEYYLVTNQVQKIKEMGTYTDTSN